MKIKTSELSGVDLDRAVAHALGAPDDGNGLPCYSTDWGQGGPIIEREGLCLWSEGYDWEAKIQIGSGEWLTEWAETPLIAAMRCYVASKLGDTIDIPKELT
jgi:hypothetical protein